MLTVDLFMFAIDHMLQGLLRLTDFVTLDKNNIFPVFVLLASYYIYQAEFMVQCHYKKLNQID